MAYQPIQMGGGSPMLDAMGRVGDSIVQAGQMRRQQEAEAEALKRQKQLDYQQAYAQAQKAFAAGDPEGAKSILAPYVGGMQSVQEGGMPPPPQDAPMQPPGPPPQMRPPPSPGDFDMDHGQAPGQMPQQPQPEVREHPFIVAQQATKAREQQKARTLLRFKDPSGQQITMDPQGQRERMQAARAQQLDAVVAESQDPEVAQEWAKIRPWVLGSNQEFDTTDVLKHLQSVSGEKQRAIFEAGREERALAAEDRRDARQDKSLAQSDKNSARSAAMMAEALRSRNDPYAKPLDTTERKAVATGERLNRLAAGLDKMQPLSDEERKVILADAANEEYLTKNPGMRVVGNAVGAVKPVTEKLSPAGRAYYNQIREIGAVILRKESGAAISADEWRGIFDRYAPSGGDKPEDIAQKRSNMQEAIGAIAAEGDRAMPARPEAPVGNPLTRAAGAAKEKRTAAAKALKGGGKAAADPHAEAVQWAKAHPGDPRAAEILRRNGMGQ